LLARIDSCFFAVTSNQLSLTLFRTRISAPHMSRIQILPPEVANLIAAGEVVERPASVVKELVENALDADAREIIVRLEQAGRELIEIRDDGCGMTSAEARLAIERHATSKIRAVSDLQQLTTLGFRGEALPSIAAVGDFTLTSRVRGDSGPAVCVQMRPPHPRPDVSVVGAPEGTTIALRRIFAQLPARQKFLKGERTELAHIQDLLLRLALVHPERRFALLHNDRTIWQAHSRGGIAERLIELFGEKLFAQLLPLHVDGAIALTGFCGTPALARTSSPQIFAYINGRAVRDRVVQHAIAEGYRTFTAHGAHPFVFLQLTMSAADVDVNVHPAKTEVRFQNSGAVHGLVAQAIRKCLASNNVASRQSPVAGYCNSNIELATQVQEPLALYSITDDRRPATGDAVAVPGDRRPATGDAFRPLGQLAATYLLYETPDGSLLIVDQHAAHERIGYDALKEGIAAKNLEQQFLLTPLVFDLPPAQCAALLEAHEWLASLRFDIEAFGEHTIIVKAVPVLLLQSNPENLLRAVAAELAEHSVSTAIEKQLDHLLMTMACHWQIRAGEVLQPSELSALLSEMQQGDSKDRCPHGRPTWIRFTRQELDKWFGRC